MRRLRADRRVGLLLAGSILLALVAIGATVVLPASDAALREPSDDALALGELERRGAAVYRAEGCAYCHTLQARETAADAVYGEARPPGAYADLEPAMLGHVRLGPDLAHVGARYGDASEIVALLRDPRRDGRASTMPSYAYLSDADVEALAAFLLAFD